MAVRLPTANELARRGPSASRQLGSGDLGGKALAGGVAELGASFSRIDEKQDRFNYGKAQSAFLQAETILQREIAEDPDWKGHEKKYVEKSKAAMGEAMKLVDNPGDRAALEQALKLQVERGLNTVRGTTRKREADAGIADLNTALEANRAAALNARDEAARAAIVGATKDMLKGAVARGWLDESAGAATAAKWQNSYAEGWVAMQPPEEREKILANPKGTPAEFLQPDQQVALLRAAQNENKETRVRGAAQAQEDAIWAGGGSVEAMRRKARAIEDPDVRDSVLTRLEARAANTLEDMNRTDALNRRAAWDVIRDGGKWEDIPAALAANMDPEDALQIKKYLASDGAVQTDRKRWTELTRQAGDDPKAFAEVDLLKDMNSLDETDFEAMVKLQESIKKDTRAGDKVAVNNAIVAAALKDMGIPPNPKKGSDNAERAAAFSYAFKDGINEVYRSTGKEPTPEERQKVADRLMIRYTKDGFLWMDEEAYLFEADGKIDPEDVIIPDQDRAQIVAALKKRNIVPTDDRIRDLYLRGKQ